MIESVVPKDVAKKYGRFDIKVQGYQMNRLYCFLTKHRFSLNTFVFIQTPGFCGLKSQLKMVSIPSL